MKKEEGLKIGKIISAFLFIILLSSFLIPSILAANPGHSASAVSAGTFPEGNFSFQGNVGIGTASPASLLDIATTASYGTPVILTFSGRSSTSTIVPYTSMGFAVENNGAASYGASSLFYTSYNGASYERMRIGWKGNVTIGTLAGTGTAYVCADANGVLYRKTTACV